MEAFYTAAPEEEEEEEDLDDFLNDAPKENKVRMRPHPLICVRMHTHALLYMCHKDKYIGAHETCGHTYSSMRRHTDSYIE